MSKLSKIMMIVWVCLAIASFVCAFFCPLIPKIIGLAFGGLNILTIISLVITYFQGIYYKTRLEKEIEKCATVNE